MPHSFERQLLTGVWIVCAALLHIYSVLPHAPAGRVGGGRAVDSQGCQVAGGRHAAEGATGGGQQLGGGGGQLNRLTGLTLTVARVLEGKMCVQR